MRTVIGHHDISKGKDHWLASPKREDLFGPLGVTNIRTFVNPENPTQVAVLMDVALRANPPIAEKVMVLLCQRLRKAEAALAAMGSGEV